MLATPTQLTPQCIFRINVPTMEEYTVQAIASFMVLIVQKCMANHCPSPNLVRNPEFIEVGLLLLLLLVALLFHTVDEGLHEAQIFILSNNSLLISTKGSTSISQCILYRLSNFRFKQL